jgi:methyl-accepting chemotaxis protein
MRRLFAPAFFVLSRLSTMGAFAMVGTLLMFAPLAGLWLATSSTAGATLAGSFIGTAALVLACEAVPLYFLIALHLATERAMCDLRGTVERIASGDLTVHAALGAVAADGSERARLWGSFEQMSRSLTGIVNQVRNSADAIVATAGNVADGNAHLSRRSHEQAATLEQTAAGMEELAATVKRNAESCSRANGLAENGSRIASRAAKQMQQVAAVMQKIDESSRSVADILGTIEGISFQTNILALNAAVEAARAGEHGHGFAVVATEVRELARRSGESAKEIKALIGDSADSVAEGTRLVDGAEATMDEVVTSVAQVNKVIAEIALASSEQSSRVDEINGAIAQMESVTQQYAALVEEAAAAAHSFEEEAARLEEVVGAFKTDRMEDRDEAVALVKRAAAYVREHGLQRAIAAFNDSHAGFVRDKYYIWASDYRGVTLAHGGDPRVCGKNYWEVKAVDGRTFIREIIETARTQGRGWCDYPWKNPASGRTEQKSTYFEAVGDDVFLACGIYKGKKNIARNVRAPASPKKVAALPAPGSRAFSR